MAKKFDRRSFLRKSLATSAGATVALSLEEKALLAYADPAPVAAGASAKTAGAAAAFPTGKIGDLTISRVICGGNLISGYAHSRDLIYVSPLLEHYFTDAKICETFQLCEQNGINTAMLKYDAKTVRIVRKYWDEGGGKIQWIAQLTDPNTLREDTQKAVAEGAVGIFTTGQMGDSLVRQGKVDLLKESIALAKDSGVIGGVSCHELAVIQACEKAGVNPDFYMKTFNSKKYWSAEAKEQLDNVFNDETPEETIALMKDLKTPWVAFKVLGAGAIDPKTGFDFAFRNGADFICVGMFDFQVEADAVMAREILDKTKDRGRTWYG